MTRPETLERKLAELPDRPGVYVYRNRSGEPIYIGKAKSLRSRVRSYFQPSAQHPPRVAQLVSEVADLETIVVDTEMEALILESNLIKREQPRYNVILRDDKHFLYIKLSTSDPFPRVSLTRRARIDRDLYVGPFALASQARRTVKLIPRFFQVATCKEVFDGKRRPCLYYHLDQCLAPCAGKTDEREYGRAVDDVKLFLQGRSRELQRSLRRSMREASERQEYERAARYRDTWRTIRRLADRQHLSSVGLEEQDYFAHHAEGGEVALQLFEMRGGKVQSRREFLMREVELEPASFYRTILVQFYSEAPPPPEVFLPTLPDDAPLIERWLTERRGRRVRLRVPQRGVKKKFLGLVRKNARLAFESRLRSDHEHGMRALETLAEALGLDEAPYRIECFDISNIQGADTVASMVVWEGGKPRKSDYRTYSIRGVRGPDDFAAIAEAVTRRYRRLIKEEKRLPDLVLIDGGAGQLGSAVRALTAVGLPMLPVASLAKREEELWLQGATEPLRLDRRSPALYLVQRIRDEAHRFAITRHRRKRARRTVTTELLSIEGIGPATARKLLREFGSVRGVRSADAEQLRRVVGPKTAERIARWSGA